MKEASSLASHMAVLAMSPWSSMRLMGIKPAKRSRSASVSGLPEKVSVLCRYHQTVSGGYDEAGRRGTDILVMPRTGHNAFTLIPLGPYSAARP